jgi:membrane fusion protein (multidrug efflux system)
MIEVTVTDDRGQSRCLSFDAPRIRIGRDADNDLVLDSDAASRHHAEIIHRAGAYQIVDLGSTNGIKIGDTKMPDVFLVDGISVVLGVHTLTFSIPEAVANKTVLLRSGALPQPPAPQPQPEREPSALYLLFRRHGETRSLKVVEGARYVVGRSPDADLVVDDDKVSKRHAVVYHEAGSFRLRDLGSANGTLLNGKTLEDGPLAPGDEIFVGGQVIVVQDQRLDLEDDALLLGRTRLGRPGELDLRGMAPTGSPSRVDREQKSRLGPWLLAASILVLAAAGYLVLRERPRSPGELEREAAVGQPIEVAPERLVVRVVPAESKELARSVRGSGLVRPHREVTVSAEIAGRVLIVSVDEGSSVENGEVLARLSDTDIRLQLDEARSAVNPDQVDLARADWERKQRLLDEGVASRAVVDAAESRYLTLVSAHDSATARTRQLEEQLRKAAIRAPLSGRVAKRFVNEGEVVAPGGPIALIENMDEVLVELELSDRDIVKVRPGQAIEATVDAFPGRVFHGAVDNAASTANPVTRTFTVEARIGNRDASLLSGMIASLRIVLEESRAVVIPLEALIDGEDAEVFVVADGEARRRSVELGERWDREVEVLSGLEPGEEVVVSGTERLVDGQAAEIYREP